MEESDSDKCDDLSLIYPQLLSPFRYAKILIQLGYEPLIPSMRHNLFSIFNIGNKTLKFPSMFTYIYYIYSKRGFIHVLTTGFLAGISFDTLRFISQQSINKVICKNEYNNIEDAVEDSDWWNFGELMMKIGIMKTCEVVIVHPFRVILTRQIAEFIVHDYRCSFLPNAVVTIIKESGIFGFYKGMLPSLLAELSKSLFYYTVCKIIYQMSRGTNIKLLRHVFHVVLYHGCKHILYPFEVVTTVMMLDGVPLRNGLILSNHGSWRQCWHHLRSFNQLSRGSEVFSRSNIITKSLI